MELEKSLTVEAYQEWIAKEQAICIYFYQEKCGVCHHLLPKVKELIENNFPRLKFYVLEAEKNKELAAQIRMMSVPGILIYFEGNEYLRSNGLIALSELEKKIKRPYQLIFE
jgi:thioredoxin 1